MPDLRWVRRPADVHLVLRVLREYAQVRRAVSQRPLQEVVAQVRLGSTPKQPVWRLSSAVTKVLGLSVGDRARCIHRALVLQRLLAAQGTASEVVIGLPADAADVRAHAWVEIGGRDAGPAPGRGSHEPMARYAVVREAGA